MAREEATQRHLAKLVARACGGDGRAFGRLYDEYADRVYAFVRARTESVQDAEDLTATVFLKAWERIDSYDDRGLPFSAWLFRIARNALVDEYRRANRQPRPLDEPASLPETEVDGPEMQVVAAADAQRLRQAVRELTEEQASVIALRFWWDLSLKETAEALDKNENSIKALQHRAVRALARMLQEDGRHG